MNQIKKYAAVGGAIAMVACWPLVVGQIGQNLAQDQLKGLNYADIKLELVSFDRGYLSSHLVTKLTVTDPKMNIALAAENLPTEWYLDSVIDHGVFSLDSVTTLRDFPNIPFQAQSKTQLSGDTHVNASLASFEQAFSTSQQEWSLNMQPVSLVADIRLDGLAAATFSLEAMRLTDQMGAYFSISDMQGDMAGVMERNLWIGGRNITVKSIEFGQPDEESLSLVEGLSSRFSATQDDGKGEHSPLYSSHSVVTIDKVILSEQQVDDITLDVVTGDADANSLNVIIEALQPEREQQSQKPMMEAIDRLVNNGLFINIDQVSFSYLNQPVDAKLALTILAGTDHITQTPMTLMALLKGELEVQVPKALVEQVPNLQLGIDQLRAKEYIVDTGADFEFSAMLEEGNIVFSNGQKTPLMTALMPLFMR
jgi:uncharacterized protein YdgA (DUF945 family)